MSIAPGLDQLCVLCAHRNRKRRLETGHICTPCITHISDQLDDILRLAALATVEPRTSSRGGGRTIPSSKPTINVDGISPELTSVLVATEWTTVLKVLESWEVLIRDARHMPAYGPASAFRAIKARRGFNDTSSTLTGVTGFLRASLPWWQSNPDMPIEDFANEVRLCRRAMAHYDPDTQPIGTMIRCPTLLDTAECGYRLHFTEPDEHVTCRRCGVTRDAMTLVTVALTDRTAHVWVDPEAAEKQTGCTTTTLRRWASRGLIHANHGRYDLREIHDVIEQERATAHTTLLRRVLPT